MPTYKNKSEMVLIIRSVAVTEDSLVRTVIHCSRTLQYVQPYCQCLEVLQGLRIVPSDVLKSYLNVPMNLNRSTEAYVVGVWRHDGASLMVLIVLVQNQVVVTMDLVKV
jgi:hypothetical protein